MKTLENILTVIVPVYNDEANIMRCLESLFNQTLLNMEIIVINDASTDNTLEILNSYQKKHKFKIINMNKNVGASSCRNAGILESHTPYITFIDSDDWIDISSYEKCLEQICINPDVIIFGLLYDYVQYNHREEKYHYPSNYKINGEFALNIYAHTIPTEISITPIVNNKVYRRQFLIDNNILFHENLRYQEDDVFTFEVLAKSDMIVFVKDCSYHYCQRNDSMIHTVSEASIRGFIMAYLTLEKSLKSNNMFDKYKNAFYLKFKSSLLSVLKRTLDYELNIKERNKLINLLLILLIDNFDIPEILNTFDFLNIRNFL